MVQRWEYAQLVEGQVVFSHPRRRPQSVQSLAVTMHELGAMGFELVSAYGVSTITGIGGSVKVSMMAGIGTSGKQKVEGATEHFMWFKRPMAEGE